MAGSTPQGIVAPISPYVFIGRGRDFAWSLTSAEQREHAAVPRAALQPRRKPRRRANPTTTCYNGECIAMTIFDAGELGPRRGGTGTRGALQ